MTSKELREAGYLPNNSLRDQRVALQWIMRYIRGFGGNTSRVTLSGQSAGATSCALHLQAEQPLFQRMILMSGTSFLMPTLSQRQSEEIYQRTVRVLQLDHLAPAERVRSLVTMDISELCSKTVHMYWGPTEDDEFPLSLHTFSSFPDIYLPGREWCKAILIGDVQEDGLSLDRAFDYRIKTLAREFRDHIVSRLEQEHGSALLSAYGIEIGADNDVALRGILAFANDVMFYVPTVAYAETLSRDIETYVYRFNEPNPWHGRWHGRATHTLDVAMLTQKFNKFLEDPQRKLAEVFAKDLLTFVNGESPWTGWLPLARIAKVYGPEGSIAVAEEDNPATVRRRTVVNELARYVGLEKIRETLIDFLSG